MSVKEASRPNGQQHDPERNRMLLDKIQRELAKFVRDQFWGEVTLKMKDGEITTMNKIEYLKTDEL